MKKFLLSLTDGQHRQLKVMAAKEGTTMTAYLCSKIEKPKEDTKKWTKSKTQ